MALQKFESPLPHDNTTDSALVISRLSFRQKYCAKFAPMNYKGIRLVKGKRYYVEYYYLVPEELRYLYNGVEWQRFRKYEQVNRLKGEDREVEARLLLDDVKFALEKGYNPLKHENNYFVKKRAKSYTAHELINFFIDNINERHLDKDSEGRYISKAKLLRDYLNSKGLQNIEPDKIDSDLIQEFLLHNKAALKWSNRNYNNILNYLSIMFNFLKEKKKIKENPCNNIKKLRSISKMHRYYDENTLKKVLKTMQENDNYVLLMAQFVYYAGIRSSKELINLQVGDILMDRDRLRLRGEGTKGNREDYILLDPKLKEIVELSGIMDYPSKYYIFTPQLIPGEKRCSDEFIQKRFRKIRRAVGLSEEYTLYGLKHTRAIHLLMDGAQPVDIMQLFRHRDLSATTKYIRDLGFDLNAKFTKISRDL